MGTPILVSILINNYNYGRFVGQAIESALAQNYRPVEVIVVDDGSSDHSRAVIASYAGRIIAVMKENGGQASAFNTGFAVSRGDIIIFLDADDLLLPDIAERVVKKFQKNPAITKIQYRLEVIDAEQRRTGQVKPSWDRQLPRGDLRKQVLTFPDDIPWQPTSGNAFTASALRQILPMPEEPYRLCADYYVSNLVPLFGAVEAIDEVGGCYRIHASNLHHATDIQLQKTREIIIRTSHTHNYIQMFANALGLTGASSTATGLVSITYLAHRMVSIKLDASHHPLPQDKPFSLFIQGVRTAAGRFDVPWQKRFLYSLWFALALFAPAPVMILLAQKLFHPEKMGMKMASLLRSSWREHKRLA